MRFKPVLFLVFSIVWMCASAQAQEEYYLSQVANGRYSEGSFRTTFVLFNTTNNSVSVTIRLTNDNGGPLKLTIPGLGTGDEFKLTLNAGGTRLLQTDGLGNLEAGAARVQASAKIGVSAIFTVYDSSGNFLTESGVGSSESLTEFILPVDSTGSFNTGVAFFNFESTAVTITVRLLDTSGVESGRTTLTLVAGGHVARFVSGAGQLFPAVSNFRGTVVVTSPTPIAAAGLRQNSLPLSYTSLPAVPRSSTKTEFNLPQVANGSFSDGSFRTTFLIFNISSSSANVQLSLTDDNGAALSVTIPGRGANSTFSITLAAGASAFLQTDGSGALLAGAARITSNVPLGAAAIFTVFDTKGAFKTEAGVGDAVTMTQLTIPADITGSFDTAVAFYNPGSSTITLTIKLLDESGFVISTSTPITLAARNHTARFLTGIFSGTKDFRGSAGITVTGGGVAALTLRQNASPLSYTTLPVASGAAQGTTQVSPLLSKTRSGINASADLTLNETLAPGFRLSGAISGSGDVVLVIARSDSTPYYATINSTTRRYLVVVPAGTYELTVCYSSNLADQNRVESTYLDPSTVQVSGDTTRNIVLPAMTLFNVTGTVTGLSSIPSGLNPTIEFVAMDSKVKGNFQLGANGAFQGQLTNGSYTASLSVLILPSTGQYQNLSIYNLGSLTVTSAAASATYAVPATARLSGKISIAGLTSLPAFSTYALAVDKSLPPPNLNSCVIAISTNIGFAEASGNYQVLLANQRSYGLSVSYSLFQGSVYVGTIQYPVTEINRTLSGDGTLNFDLPALPIQVTISGRITDNSGRGVKDVSVYATSEQLTGAANMRYSGFSTTDANGNYKVVVLQGTNYEVYFTPPSPQP